MIGKVEAMLSADFRRCKEVTLAEVKARPLLLRFLAQATRLLSPIL